jgi:hypothetical protein
MSTFATKRLQSRETLLRPMDPTSAFFWGLQVVGWLISHSGRGRSQKRSLIGQLRKSGFSRG